MKIATKFLSVLLAVMMLATAMTALAVSVNALDVGDTIYFGAYPQTAVASTPALEAAADKAVWKSYGYYVGNDQFDGSLGLHQERSGFVPAPLFDRMIFRPTRMVVVRRFRAAQSKRLHLPASSPSWSRSA